MKSEPILLLVLTLVVLVVSGIGPYDRLTWVLEVFPVLLAIPILLITARRFPLTPLAYRLIFLHAVVLMIGGHYTYSRVPIGNWVQDLFGLARNHYDRLGHFTQGFVPAILAREILLRRSPLVRGKWLFFLVVSVCLAISATYEFIEWWSALLGGAASDAFLGTQGDPWDTQWDMFLAFVGAVTAQLLLGRAHDRQLAMLPPASTHESRDAGGATSAVDELLAIEQRLARAWVEGDRSWIDGLLSEDWKVADAGGHVLTKAEVMSETFGSSERRIDAMQIDDVTVRLYGNMAIVTGRTQASGSYKGTSASVRLRFTDVFEKRGGRWRVLASHASQIAD